MGIFETIAAAFGGGLTGLLGSVFTLFGNYFMLKAKNKHELEMIKANSNAMIAEANANIQIEKAKTEGQVAISEVEVLKESYKQFSEPLFDKSYMEILARSPWTNWIAAIISFLFGVVDFMIHACRPTVTYYLIGMSTWITIMAYDILEARGMAVLTADQAYALFNTVVMTMVYLTTTTVSWWFCDRQTRKFMDKFLATDAQNMKGWMS